MAALLRSIPVQINEGKANALVDTESTFTSYKWTFREDYWSEVK